jgi:8-oxo-dGTP pyrophosphatase MutT (NUDIX family)
MLQELLQVFERVVMQPYWRLTRSHTLGVQGIVIKSGTEVLLVRQSYAPGWQFPGGGVDRDEHVINALERELLEEAAVAINGAPRLHGIFANFPKFKGDLIVAYVVEHWRPIGERRAPTFSHKSAISLMKVILVASSVFAAYFISSAERRVV